MKMLTIFLLAVISFCSQAMEVTIACHRLDGDGGCKIHNGSGSFLSINSKRINFIESNECSWDRCDYLGKANPNYLKVGKNDISFQVSTFTDHSNLHVYHLYKFFFAGTFRDEFYSRRTGSNLDQTQFSLHLNLKEIDPALYREYLLARADLANMGQMDSLERKWREWKKELSEVEDELRALHIDIATLSNLELQDIDPALVEKLGIARNQFLLLSARQDELNQFIADGEKSAQREEAEAIARYETVRARAKKYKAELEEIPVPPIASSDSSTSISPMISALADDLSETLTSFEKAVGNQDVSGLRSSIKKWKTLSDYVMTSYLTVDQNEFNNSEMNLLYRLVSHGTRVIFKNGITNDLWTNLNEINPEIRKELDGLAVESPEGKKLRETLYFKKIPESLKNEVELTLEKAVQLSQRIKLLDDKKEKEAQSKKIAEATLSVALDAVNESIKTGNKDGLADAQDSLTLGMKVIDVALSITPVVSSLRDTFEFFTGKNMITGEKFDTLDYSIAFIGMTSALVGGNLAKIAFERAWKLAKKISGRSGIGGVPKISWQVENIFEDAKKLNFSKFSIKEADEINGLLSKKYQRFTIPPFKKTRSVIHRISEKGEEYCRFYSSFLKNGRVLNNKIDMSGGIFVARCADVLNKSIAEIKELLAIPDRSGVVNYHMTKISLPSGIPIYQGQVAEMNGKTGGGFQIFLDTQMQEILESWNRSPIDKVIEDVFRGF